MNVRDAEELRMGTFLALMLAYVLAEETTKHLCSQILEIWMKINESSPISIDFTVTTFRGILDVFK